MSETTTMEVIVHKAMVPMMKGESLNMFTRKLSDAGRGHVMRKLNISEKDGGAWMVEAFQDRVVFSTYKSQEPTKHYAFKYTRAKGGDFEFGGVIEVERMVAFKPKNDIPVTKAKKAEDEDPEKGCDKPKKAEDVAKAANIEEFDISKGAPEEFGGWKQTHKSFWMGVL